MSGLKTSLTLKPLALPNGLDPAPIVAVAYQNRCMLIAQSNGDLTRYLPDEKESVKIKFVAPAITSSGIMSFVASQPSTTTVKVDVASIFMSESAMHALIASANGESYYLGLESSAATTVSKLKGHVVTAARFIENGDIIVGTQAGKIFCVSSELQNVKPLGELPAGERVTDITSHANTCFVSSEIGAYSTSLSGGSLTLIWQSPVACLSSRFVLHNDIGGSVDSKHISWLNGVCVVTSKVQSTNAYTLVPHALGSKPRGLLVTDFHYITLLESGKLSLVSRISLGAPVASVATAPSSHLAGDLVWSGGQQRKMNVVVVTNERADSWRHWIKKRNYAKALSSTNIKTERAYVLKHEADFLLDTAGDARKAASLYARALKEDLAFIESQFEEITLRLESYDRESVLELVVARMDVSSEDASREVVQLSVLFVYSIHLLVELITEAPNSAERTRLAAALLQFVSEKHSALDKECISTVFELLESVGLYEELVSVAHSVGDIIAAVRVELKLGRYENVIKRLAEAPQTPSTADLIVSLSPLLFRFCPQDFVGLALKQSQIDVFLPTLAACGALGKEHRDQAVLLLKSWLAKGHTKGVDLLLHLLCEMNDEPAVVQLIESNHAYLDPSFVLRCVSQSKMARAETALLSAEGFHLSATERALNCGDLEMAKSYASRSSNPAVRRKCWLAILSSVSDPSAAVEIMKESGVIDVTDILPLLAQSKDEESVRAIKPEVDECIKQMHAEVESTKNDIKNYQEALGQIRSDITAKPNECILLSHSQKCDLCSSLVFSERFLAFNCGHCFHEECLKEALTKRLVGSKSEKDKTARISSSCCLCGHNSLLMEQLFEPFVDPAIDAPAILAWAVSC